MVKVIKRSHKELEKEARLNKLEKIAREVCGEKFDINTAIGNIYLYSKQLILKNPDIHVYLMTGQNIILVSDPNYLNDAIKLAKTYEASDESEFIVKKYYDK